MSEPQPPDEVLAFYALGLEAERLELDHNRLERARTQELILRELSPAPRVVLDVGGAAGAYASGSPSWDTSVHLLDPVPLHVEQARASERARLQDASGERSDRGRARAALRRPERRRGACCSARSITSASPPSGRARSPKRCACCDRQACCSHRQSRASHRSWTGCAGRSSTTTAFARIVEHDLATGEHRNDTSNPRYFTTAYFHHPAELGRRDRRGRLRAPGRARDRGPGRLDAGLRPALGRPRGARAAARVRARASRPSPRCSA